MTLVLEGNRKALHLAKLNGNVVSSHQEPDDLDPSQADDTKISEIDSYVDQALVQDYPAIDKMVIAEDVLECCCPSAQATRFVKFTQRGYLTISTLGRILKEDPSLADLSSIYLAHTVLLEHSELSDRRLTLNPPSKKLNPRLSSFVEHFSKIASSILMNGSWARSMEIRNAKCDVADLIDGRLLQILAQCDNDRLMTGELASAYGSLAQALCHLSGIHLKPTSGNGGSYEAAAPPNGTKTDSLAILPFSNAVFDKHLDSISIANARPIPDPQMGRIHREITHWHNAKRPLIVKVAAPVNPREAKRIMKRNDFFMAEMQAYAASLTNATGKSLEPDIVTVSDKPSNKAVHSKDSNVTAGHTAKSNTSKPTKGKTSGKKPTGKQAMLNDIAASKAVKDSDSVEKIFSSWRVVREDLAAEKSLQNQYFKMKSYLNNLSEPKKLILKAEVQWSLLNVLLAMYTILLKEKNPQFSSGKYGIAAMLFDIVRKLATTEGLTRTIAGQLQIVINALRLPSIDIRMPLIDRKLAYDPGMRLIGKGELDLGLEPHEFQLAYSGPYMDRNLDSAPDSRVPFEPDGWQRKVLDELDQDHSIFVVAPTSAGKTFISFYAMERILRANDDGVLGRS